VGIGKEAQRGTQERRKKYGREGKNRKRKGWRIEIKINYLYFIYFYKI
jgi:hypothetical protein